jgi:hypothetical protein
VAKVARETGVAAQMGNMGHSGEGIRRTCEGLWAGVIGTVREVHAWGDGGRWITRPGPPPETPPVPTGLDWDLWLGPRPMRPYHPDYTPSTWRGWWAFGGGNLGDMGCHNLDPEIPLEGGGNGICFLGDQGVISCAGWGGAPRLLPHSLRENFQPPPPVLPRSKGHIRDWLDASKGGPPASSNFEYGARLTEMVLLGNVALRAGVKILWDADAMKATNAPEADAFLKGEYRSGWGIS